MRYLAVIGTFFIMSLTANAQYQTGGTIFVTNTGYSSASVTFKTGYSDVACAGGLCLVPGVDKFGNNQAVAVIPQSTAFFALSNPSTIEFRTRQFVQVPHSTAIVATDSFGNQVILNGGILPATTTRSRGQVIFSK